MPEAAASACLPADCWQQIFGTRRPLAVEIGPGRGEFLLASARREPGWSFFAIEHSASRALRIADQLVRQHVDNARVLSGDAACLVELFPPASVTAFYVLFPDPWWKRRHWKRRLWTPRFAAALDRALAVNGTVELITDVAAYFASALFQLNAAPGLEVVTVGHPATLQTSFARKAARRGTPIYRSVHRKRA